MLGVCNEVQTNTQAIIASFMHVYAYDVGVFSLPQASNHVRNACLPIPCGVEFRNEYQYLCDCYWKSYTAVGKRHIWPFEFFHEFPMDFDPGLLKNIASAYKTVW